MRPQLLPLAHAAAACLTPVHGWSPAAVPTRALPCAAPRAAVLRLCDAGDAEMDGGSSNWLEGEEQEIVEDAELFRKQKGKFRPHVTKDDRDKLLYDVKEITPPPTNLGQFRLGPSAACGDLISARVRFEDEAEKLQHTFVIKKVSYRYEFQRGRYRMVGKGAQVKRTDRDATEAFLERMLPEQSGDEDTAARRSDSSSSSS